MPTSKLKCVAAAVPFLVMGCDECENGYKIKTENVYLSHSDKWYDGLPDGLLDGAIRTTTWTLKDSRGLEIRCFKPSIGAEAKGFDLRYSINVPLLQRLGPDIERAGPNELVLAVDGATIGSIKARPITHDDGVSFLADLTPETLEKLTAAKETIVAMPRQANKNLDSVIKFGVAELSKHIEPVKKACKPLSSEPNTENSLEPEPQKPQGTTPPPQVTKS
jgi:hypothetical protein